MENQNQFVSAVVSSEIKQQLEDGRKKNSRSQPRKIYQLKIALKGITRDTWRRVLIPSGLSFADLHDIIQCLFEWENLHYYEYEVGDQIIALEERNGLGLAELVDQTVIDSYMKKNAKIKYIYDFRDEWIHEILVEDIFTKRDAKYLDYKKFPVCTQANQAAPLEECRGRIRYGRQTFTNINTQLGLLPCYQGLL